MLLCSWQSNMWLPMGFSLSRNRTYDRLRAGELRHIRMYTVDMNMIVDEAIHNQSFDAYIGNPPKPYDGTAFEYPGGGWLLPSTGDYPNGASNVPHWTNNTVDTFSAACWYFAQELTDLRAKNNETEIPFGLLSTSWGGTVVEVWTNNASATERSPCKYVDGNATHDSHGRPPSGRPSGSLFNGMILPYTNYSIRGAVWYRECKQTHTLSLAHRGRQIDPYRDSGLFLSCLLCLAA